METFNCFNNLLQVQHHEIVLGEMSHIVIQQSVNKIDMLSELNVIFPGEVENVRDMGREVN